MHLHGNAVRPESDYKISQRRDKQATLRQEAENKEALKRGNVSAPDSHQWRQCLLKQIKAQRGLARWDGTGLMASNLL